MNTTRLPIAIASPIARCCCRPHSMSQTARTSKRISFISRRCFRVQSPRSTPADAMTAPAALAKPVQRNPFTALATAYSRAQKNHPYRTQIASFLVIWLIGDLSTQLVFPPKVTADQEAATPHYQNEEYASYDITRTLRHLSIGALAAVPTFKWFMFLHRAVKLPSRIGTIAAQVVIQQAVYNPVFNVYFLGMHSLLAGHGIQDTREHLATVLPTSIVRGMQLWTGVAIISFGIVPPQWRGVFSGCVAVCWQTYLGCLARSHRGEKKEQLDEQRSRLNR